MGRARTWQIPLGSRHPEATRAPGGQGRGNTPVTLHKAHARDIGVGKAGGPEQLGPVHLYIGGASAPPPWGPTPHRLEDAGAATNPPTGRRSIRPHRGSLGATHPGGQDPQCRSSQRAARPACGHPEQARATTAREPTRHRPLCDWALLNFEGQLPPRLGPHSRVGGRRRGGGVRRIPPPKSLGERWGKEVRAQLLSG